MKIDVTTKQNILIIQFSGDFEESDKENFVETYFSLIRENNPKYVVIDSRELIGRFSIGELFFLIKKFAGSFDRTYEKVAVVETPESISDIEFFKVFAWNEGLRTQVFYDMQSALEWFNSSNKS